MLNNLQAADAVLRETTHCALVQCAMLLGFPVVITLSVITVNEFFHLRTSITRNYVLITYTKESLVLRNQGVITQNYVIRNHSVISKVHIYYQKLCSGVTFGNS